MAIDSYLENLLGIHFKIVFNVVLIHIKKREV